MGGSIMEQLLKITNVPIAFTMNVQHARLEYNNVSADLQITRNKGGLQIKSSPIKLNLDTFQARNSVRHATTGGSIREYAEKGRSAAYEATASYASDGHLLLKAKLGDDALGQIIKKHTDQFMQQKEVNIDFIPKSGAEITATGGDITIDYMLDKLNFDWKTQQGTLEFIPGDIEISISQMPDVKIEYVGSPIYVPPSADPDYEPIDIKA